MDLTPRLNLMNWLVSQGLTGLPENEVLRGFCERCRAEGLELSRGLVFIDTLHPIYEGRGFRWSDVASNESDSFEYRSSSEGARRGSTVPVSRAYSTVHGVIFAIFVSGLAVHRP
jgi:adenylate cyclase